jgi:SAM-dependent methyltransferase
MAKRWSPLTRISFETGVASTSCQGQNLQIEPVLVLMLELFVHHNSIVDAYDAYNRLVEFLRSNQASPSPEIDIPKPSATLLLIHDSVFVCPTVTALEAYRLANLQNKTNRGTIVLAAEYLSAAMRKAKVKDLSKFSRRTPLVGDMLARSFALVKQPYPVLTIDEFLSHAESLATKGLLTIPFGDIAFGDLRRTIPFCPDYGYSRGTPIDRFYLSQFVLEIRDKVAGATLEVGGRRYNRDLYGFHKTSEYITMDLAAHGSEVDIVGDVHDVMIHRERRFDSIVLFNVLEHCVEPWTVINNTFRWLKSGGNVFCAVPNAQRIHSDPKDYWRILPDAVGPLFQRFSNTQVKTYGNLLTVNASLSGIAAEELGNEELNERNADYPVVTCIVATKT